MTTRSEREKAQKLNEQHQAILAALLREEDNKYCADCEAKGPRWASWNLGVFICIRCAGIHRNLGVHIARVKSVNLDQWTSEQIQHMQDMGNGKAKKLYEGFLPKDFRRPVSDQAAEAFIRDKYDKKRYMDRNADMSSPKRNVEKDKEKDKKDKKKKENKSPAPEKSQPKPQEQQSMGTPAVQTAAEPAIDLLGLESPTAASNGDAQSAAPASEDQDIFGPMVSNPLPQSTQAEADASPASSADDAVKRQLSKDSILSLYASQPPPPATAAVNSQGVFGYGQPGMAFPGPAGVYSAQAISGVGVGGGGVGMPPGVPPPGCTSAVGNPNPNPMQWGLGQMTEQMSGLGLVPAGVMVGDVLAWPPGASGGPGCPAPPAAGRTLSTQLWK
ncbi:stromal membrane-associated protein 1-like [Lampetra fluviatilis]